MLLFTKPILPGTTHREFHKICLRIQGAIDAEKQMSDKRLKTQCRKATKRYLKRLKKIEQSAGFTMHEVN